MFKCLHDNCYLKYKMQLKKITQSISLFLYAFFVVLTLLFCCTLLYGKTACFINANAYHSTWLNIFFIKFTFIGDGIFSLILIAILYFLFKQKKIALALLCSFLISGIAVQIIKNLVHAPRPKLFFETRQYLYFIDGVTYANHASFPSGHTTTAFAMAIVLAYFIKNKFWHLPILFMAILVGYSRIYLAQHFLEDVIAGALLGSMCGILSIHIILNTKLVNLFTKEKNKFAATDIANM